MTGDSSSSIDNQALFAKIHKSAVQELTTILKAA